MIGVGADVIPAFGGVVLVTAALSLFIALYDALNERAYDIAVLRTLGSRPLAIALMLMVEALICSRSWAVCWACSWRTVSPRYWPGG